MTKIQKSKKTIASLLAGILLCQVSAFGVSQTSVNAENPARKMSFEVVGEGYRRRLRKERKNDIR